MRTVFLVMTLVLTLGLGVASAQSAEEAAINELIEEVSYLLHSGDPKMLWSRRGPAPALSRPGRGPAPTTEETPALLLRRPSGGLWMQRGRLVSEGSGLASERVCQGSDLSPFQRPK